MPIAESLSVKQARRLALAAQGFTQRRPAEVQRRHVRAMLERLGVLQIDSVNALVRSHYLPLFSRLGTYPLAMLEEAAWSSGRQRRLFEYWGHEASLLPLELYPLMRWRMRRASEGRGIYQQLARFGREQQPVIRRVLDAVRDQGALGAGSLSSREERAGPWWDWSAEKYALEWLFAAGEVTVAGRRGFERLYDLPERVLPPSMLAGAEPDEPEAQRRLLLHSARALGVATEKDLRDYFRFEPGDSKARLAELVEEGALLPVRVQGWQAQAYCPADAVIPRKVAASALLSPFDSLVWERARTERLFDFRYRLEIYTPQHKRVYGYYVLPFLFGERLVARVDLRAERAGGQLVVHAVHDETPGPDEAAWSMLAERLDEMADWLGLQRVTVHCRRPSGVRLKALLRAR